jgi:hypothetical protein
MKPGLSLRRLSKVAYRPRSKVSRRCMNYASSSRPSGRGVHVLVAWGSAGEKGKLNISNSTGGNGQRSEAMDQFSRANIKAQLSQDIAKEQAQRTVQHEIRVNQNKQLARYREAHNIAAVPTRLDCLAIGDSWFDYPLNDYGLPWPNQDIVAQLETLGNPSPIIFRRAIAGQASTAVMGLTNQELYMSDIATGSWLSGKPDAILVSAGGDDIAGDQFVIYLDYVGGGLSSRIKGVIDSVEASYQALFQFRDVHAPGTPIFGHCYDYAIPNGSRTIFGGPWLKPSLDATSYNYSQGLAIVKQAIDDFYAILNGLASVAKNNFILVDTRGTLTRDMSHPLGWANEIHPYTDGFISLAAKFVPALRGKFPGRI